jgi:hypothetical protein
MKHFMAKTKNPLLRFEDKWVALKPRKREVIASAATIKELDKKLKKLKIGKNQALVTKVFPFERSFAP